MIDEYKIFEDTEIICNHKNDESITSMLYSLNRGEYKQKNLKLRHIDRSGTKKWLSVTGYNTYISGNIYNTMIIITDITELMDMSLKLKMNTYNLEHFFDITTDAIYETDKDFNILNVNGNFKKLVGDTESDYVGRYIYDFVSDKSRNELIGKNIQRIRDVNKNVVEKKIIITDATGKEHLINVSSVFKFDEKDNFTGSFGIIKDISITIDEYKQEVNKLDKLTEGLNDILEDSAISNHLKDINKLMSRNLNLEETIIEEL